MRRHHQTNRRLERKLDGLVAALIALIALVLVDLTITVAMELRFRRAKEAWEEVVKDR